MTLRAATPEQNAWARRAIKIMRDADKRFDAIIRQERDMLRDMSGRMQTRLSVYNQPERRGAYRRAVIDRLNDECLERFGCMAIPGLVL